MERLRFTNVLFSAAAQLKDLFMRGRSTHAFLPISLRCNKENVVTKSQLLGYLNFFSVSLTPLPIVSFSLLICYVFRGLDLILSPLPSVHFIAKSYSGHHVQYIVMRLQVCPESWGFLFDPPSKKRKDRSSSPPRDAPVTTVSKDTARQRHCPKALR